MRIIQTYEAAALKKYLMNNYHDVDYGGARRDEEASRSKRRIVSHRDKTILGNFNQNVEPWNIFNTTKLKKNLLESFQFQTGLKLILWEYIESQNIAVVLYFAKKKRL